MLVVPQVIVGRRGDRTWLTTISVDAPALQPSPPPRAPVGLTFSDGALNGEEWMGVVADAVTRINAGDLEKVVLARDLIASTDEPLDVRWPLQPARRALRDVLDLPRRRHLRRHPRDARAPRARPGDLARARRHHPAYG